MRSALIVEVEISTDRCARLANALVGPQINLLVFDAAPQPLDEHVVSPSPFTVHADRNAIAGEHTGEGGPRELRTLIGIEDLRLTVPHQSVLQCLDTECRFHCDGYAPRQHAAACPVENDSEVDGPPRHGDVRDVHRPNLVRARDLLPAQQIWIDLVPGFWLCRARTAIQRLYPHPPH